MKGMRYQDSWLKRGLDLVLAVSALVVTAPLAVLVAVLIKLEDGGPVLYREARWGRGGHVFHIYKFRTTVIRAGQPAVVDPSLGPRRFTRVGYVLRQYGIDELPQVLNILKGDMSFVGPRPLALDDVTPVLKQEYGEKYAFFRKRLSVRPGMTGIAQVFGTRYLPHRCKFRYDAIYVDGQSLPLDLWLLVMSLWVSVRGKWQARGRKIAVHI